MLKCLLHTLCVAVAIWCCCTPLWAVAAPVTPRFKLVIDAGHGGHDPGAVGRVAKEKTINLNVALSFGRMVERNCPDVQVIYTRKTDVFIPLDDRAEKANKNKANLFISIHTNALPKGHQAYGAETYTMGMARAKENLEVAKRENSVILQESDYQERYQGFDPRSSESYIMFEVMQDKFMAQSVELARFIQKEFHQTAGRQDKGVHQAGFLVLRKTTMPSVLVELGYISTPAEERFLSSDAGVESMARSIYNAFVRYRRQQTGGKVTAAAEVAPTTTTATTAPTTPTELVRVEQPKRTVGADRQEPVGQKADDMPASLQPESRKLTREAEVAASAEVPQTVAGDAVVFKVQFLTAPRQLTASDSRLADLDEVSCYQDGGTYKYTSGATDDYNKACRVMQEVRKRYKDAFLVAFEGERRIPVSEAIQKTKK